MELSDVGTGASRVVTEASFQQDDGLQTDSPSGSYQPPGTEDETAKQPSAVAQQQQQPPPATVVDNDATAAKSSAPPCEHAAAV